MNNKKIKTNGGKNNIQGIAKQTLVGVINAFKDREWIELKMEPETSLDKVDIILLYENNTNKTIQVKTTRGNFSESKIKEWLLNLVKDKDSKEYNLSLVTSVQTNKIVKIIGDINEKKFDFKNSILNDNKNKISISVYSYQEDELIRIIEDEVRQLVVDNDITVNRKNERIQEVSKILFFNFFSNSIDIKHIKRKDFENEVYNLLIETKKSKNPDKPLQKEISTVKNTSSQPTYIPQPQVILRFEEWRSLNQLVTTIKKIIKNNTLNYHRYDYQIKNGEIGKLKEELCDLFLLDTIELLKGKLVKHDDPKYIMLKTPFKGDAYILASRDIPQYNLDFAYLNAEQDYKKIWRDKKISDIVVIYEINNYLNSMNEKVQEDIKHINEITLLINDLINTKNQEIESYILEKLNERSEEINNQMKIISQVILE